MSIEAISWVWKKAEASGSKLLLLLALADYADDKGESWPSNAALAAKARVNERTVRRLLRELEDEGALKTILGGGRKHTSRYVLTLEKEGNMPPLISEKGGIEDAKGGHLRQKRGVSCPPEPSGTVSEPSARKNPDWASVENLNLEWWSIWLAHRRKCRYRPLRTIQEAKALARHPWPVQQAAIEQSMDKGWQGLFPEKVKANGSGRTNGEARTRFEQHRERLAEWYEEQVSG